MRYYYTMYILGPAYQASSIGQGKYCPDGFASAFFCLFVIIVYLALAYMITLSKTQILFTIGQTKKDSKHHTSYSL